MSQTPLTRKAESIRNEIKALIPQAEILEDDGKGNRMFGGDNLANKLWELKKELNASSWGYTLWEFTGPTKIGNQARQMHLVTLSKGSSLVPGGDLIEGQSVFLTDERILSPNARIIIITPKVNN